MSTIATAMTADHRRCDEIFSRAEELVSSGDWTSGEAEFTAFREAMLSHFSMEEERLFPAFEQHLGHAMGPTQVMRMEHMQMRQLFTEMEQAVGIRDDARYLGLSETLMMIMQQHNMKEEQMLYPMMDRTLGQAGGEIAQQIGQT
ncbi:MAG: hemerythrin domain-containing protein [Gammaproteobacteria bacterium]|nr:hemerythrin domain-containing protein [Gammaproteobacteria bacterium]HXK56747.1 hemerythrin domain-containing protein [Gammaproteobacteria bacterium]